MLGFGRSIFGAMGGRGAALDAAVAYSNILFGGAVVIWSTNVLSAVVRGAGNMLLPSLMLLATAFVHLLLCPLLVFGWGPVPADGRPRRRRQHALRQRRRGAGPRRLTCCAATAPSTCTARRGACGPA